MPYAYMPPEQRLLTLTEAARTLDIDDYMRVWNELVAISLRDTELLSGSQWSDTTTVGVEKAPEPDVNIKTRELREGWTLINGQLVRGPYQRPD